MTPTNFPVEGEVANREGSQIGDLPLLSNNLVRLVCSADIVQYPAVEVYAGTLRVLVSPDTPDRGRGVPSPSENRDPRGTPNPHCIQRWVQKMNGGLGAGCRTNLEYCVFCKNNNEDVKVYRDHKIKVSVQCFMHFAFQT